MEDEVKNELNDTQEDVRENEEETKYVENEKEKDDLQEDNRETNEELEKLKQTVLSLTTENEELRRKLEEMNNSFLNGEIETEKAGTKRDYDKLTKGVI